MQADDERLLDDVADAILDGTPVDWARVASRAAGSHRALVDRLRVLAALADVHRDSSAADAPRWGHLELIAPIGRGAFGVVYRARDTRLDREVALKLLPADSTSGETGASAIIEEGRLLAQVRHPNVVTIHGAEQIGGQIGLSMELVNGWTLEQVLEQGKRFEAPEVVEIGIQLCGAIAAVHKAGLLHRDIKTQNVMRADDGRLVLMDFGTGREVGDGSTGGLAGTPLYLAPELLSGYEPTIRSDIYSLGVLLYHLLTGSYPVRADRLSDLRRAHERGERTDLRTARPAVRSKLARIIDRAIDPAPERRYQTVDALREDLQAQQPPSTNVRALSVLAAAAAILLIASVGWEMGGRRAGWHSTPTTLVAEIVGLTRGSATDDAIGSPVIAVLPFEDLSPRRENDELADGLTDEIIRSLASVQGLQVRARASSFAFKGKPHDLREVGQQLGANLVVEGSIQRSGDTLRIDARLVQVAGSVPLWAETFDRTVKGILTVEAEIAQAIVTRLRLTLGAGQRRYDFDVDTYILYLKARARLGRRGGDDAKAASALFQQVVQRDPAFAPAYAGLADAYGLMSHPTLLPGVVEAAIPLMQQAADKALELDPLLAEGHAALGFVFARQKSWDKAHSSFQRAIDLNPALTQTYINYFTTTLLPHERFDDAERVLQAAARTDPLSGTVHGELGYLKLAAGRFDEAIEHYTRARALDPNLPYINQHLGRAMTFAGRFSEALSFWETKMDPSGTVAYKESPGGQVWMAVAYVMAGRRTEVERWAEVHDEPYRLALIHAALGNKDRTFEALNRAADIVPHRVVPLLSYPEMRLLRGDPRLAALRQRLQLP